MTGKAAPPPISGPPAVAAAVAEAASWRLRLLGGFELSDGRQPLNKLGTRAAMALLARLVLQPGTAHPRETLVELLWPGVAADAGRQRLRQTLSTLKQVLEPPERTGFAVLDADRISIRLVRGAISCDALAFEAAYKRGDHAAAHALYSGELLPGFFDEWINDERLRLESLFDRLAPPAAAPAARPESSALPATATSTAAAAATAAGLGPSPSPSPGATAGLASTAPPNATLPAYLTRRVGNDVPVQRVRDAVSVSRLVTLMGPGGTGKTRLSVEVARVLAAAGSFDTVLFTPLAACRTRQELLDQVLMSLQRPQGAAGALASIVLALDSRRALLVLDNFEQVVDEGAEVVAELVTQLPLLHLLVTSRRALSVPGETELQVDALALPEVGTPLAEAAASAAVSLFVDRARAARAEFHLHEGNRAAVIELVRLLDGMPLAIELAAARVRSLTPAEMAHTLRSAREGAASGLNLLARAPQRGRVNTRHHSMQDTIDWSWQLLGPDLRELLAALTVFQAGFTARAAQAVCSSAALAADDIPLALDELLSHSLLRVHSGEAEGAAAGEDSADSEGGDRLRFGIYEPIREFAQRHLTAEAAATLRRRHRQWALAWCQAMPITPPLADLRHELQNISAAMGSAVADGEPALTLQLALALNAALDHLSLPSTAQTALEAALSACSDQPLLHSQGRQMLGQMLYRSARMVEARECMRQVLQTAPEDALSVRASALVHGVLIDWNAGERDPSLLADLAQARGLALAAQDVRLQARVDSSEADILAVQHKDFARAEVLHRQALATGRAQGDELAVLRTRFGAAQAAHFAGRKERLAWICDETLSLAQDARRLHAMAWAAHGLTLRGATLVRLKRWQEAYEQIGQSLQIAWRALDNRTVVNAMLSVLHPLARAGQPEAAQRLAGFIEAHSFQRQPGMRTLFAGELRLVRRLAQLQIGVAASEAAFAAGQRLSLGEAAVLVQEVTRSR